MTSRNELGICWVDLVFGRCTLLLLLAECGHCTWMLEQPSGSNDVLPLHPRINWLFNEVLYVTLLCNYFEVRFGMHHRLG